MTSYAVKNEIFFLEPQEHAGCILTSSGGCILNILVKLLKANFSKSLCSKIYLKNLYTFYIYVLLFSFILEMCTLQLCCFVSVHS